MNEMPSINKANEASSEGKYCLLIHKQSNYGLLLQEESRGINFFVIITLSHELQSPLGSQHHDS